MMRLILFAFPLIIAGCTVGPDLQRPEVKGVAAPWIGPTSPGPVESKWWRALGDPALDALVDTALAANLDAREAEARLLEARANRDAAAGGRFPIANVTASASEAGLSKNGQIPIGKIPGFTRTYSLFDSGFDASWEIDLWGGTRRTIEAAEARGREAEARRDDTRLQVIGEVVRAYADLRAAQAQFSIGTANAALRAEIVALDQQRAQAGESPQSDVETARQRLDTSQAALPALAAQRQAAAYRVALLTGQPPEAMIGLADTPNPPPHPPAVIAAGIRSELLQRRPDIRAADADLAAYTADIGATKAQLYPRFSILGSLGQQARSAGDLLSGDSTRFSIGPSFSWPIFSAGKIRAQVRAADARAQAAAARYQKAVLSALNDSETALNRFANAQAALQRYASARADAGRLSALSVQRFKRGEDDRIQSLESKSAELTAAQSESSAQADELNAYIAAAKALGGGW
jgi:NodT family efflux transporter outer membrane factor (OMF) lipoprotein